ncbi:hypothetical protein SXCC_04263 [Gluconacetobacter sp. SXCC-1]|nr:hypothetical protein SXCC_04263 [Gluconacetobacter sp. SXCC-1]
MQCWGNKILLIHSPILLFRMARQSEHFCSYFYRELADSRSICINPQTHLEMFI